MSKVGINTFIDKLKLRNPEMNALNLSMKTNHTESRRESHTQRLTLKLLRYTGSC